MVSEAPVKETVAVLPTTETETLRLFVAVVTAFPLVNATSDPSKLKISEAPSFKFVTVSVIDVKRSATSIVEALTVLNKSTAPLPSVNVGLPPVADKTGASLMLVTETVMVKSVELSPSLALT